MNLYKRDYKIVPTSAEIQEYEKVLAQETQDTPIGCKNLRYLYPPAIRHHQSLFPNNHIELLDFRFMEEKIGLKPEVNSLIDSFQKLIHACDTTEQDILRFINHTPAFIIPASILVAGRFTFGHHDLYLFPEFGLGAPNAPKPDYMLIGSGSGGYEFVLVEFEKSNGRITLKSGHYGEAIRKGNFQIYDWQAWMDENNVLFYEKLSEYSGKLELPQELQKYDSSRFHYVTVAGLRDDFDPVTYRRRRNQLKKEDILLLHYDNLYDSAKKLNEMTSF